jgi:hypothetical protein
MSNNGGNVGRFGCAHEVPNLGILGASVMGTSGAHNHGAAAGLDVEALSPQVELALFCDAQLDLAAMETA